MYELCGTSQGSVSSEKYLGVYLDHYLKWDYHIEQVSDKVAWEVGFIWWNFRGAPAKCN